MTDSLLKPRTLDSFSLANKVCVVTGAARGLGLEFCRAFIGSGCTTLALLDLRASELDQAVQDLLDYSAESWGIKQGDLKVIGLPCNVTSEADVIAAMNSVIDAFGHIDVVVASAGIVENYSALDYPTERHKLLFDINVNGVFYTAREAARRMIPRKSGSIILIASMSANIVNVPQLQTPYNASKAAVKHMASSLAVEWAPHNIRVNSLSPGYMLTKLTRTILEEDKELKDTWEKMTPMKRMGDPEDLAGAVVFMASDASKFMTGSEIRVDGGYCAI
ncbi:hypothetical protein DFP72DRAFT_956213 [Ephemerocybe angulata]|uniref:NAD(P)-binding protein n=1 Tax=Ephemerocybe angulata TaxID=980116 RepID=A0A8H6MCC9_9AGAR|nr:hypothetical protein DFP72DRAFT_956213 [Tulosesus angulatus]